MSFLAFLMKNYEFMHLCIMAGFNLYENEPWIRNYLMNPNFIDYTDYFVRRRADNSIALDSDGNESDDSSDTCDIAAQVEKDKTEMENLKFLETHTNARRNAWRHRYEDDKIVDTEKNAKKIYALLKYHYTNPLSLQQLARIQIRNSLLNVDYKMKFNIQNSILLPKRLKEYILFKDFNL